MRVRAASEPGSSKPNEDHFTVGPNFAVVIDGATARTETGCIHGVAWYSVQLGAAIQRGLSASETISDALRTAISEVAALHSETCDLTHSGTPSAAVVVVRKQQDVLEWLVLGDVTLALDQGSKPNVISDSHDHIAAEERAEADRFPIGDPRKDAAMVRMKHVELANRNVDGGFWVAAADPSVVEHARVGASTDGSVRRALLLTDGAARIVDVFNLTSWPEVLTDLDQLGPTKIIQAVRKLEHEDPAGLQWPRNKKSDDATVVLLEDF